MAALKAVFKSLKVREFRKRKQLQFTIKPLKKKFLKLIILSYLIFPSFSIYFLFFNL